MQFMYAIAPVRSLIILCLLLCTAWFSFWTRSKSAVTLFFAELLYLIPFVR